MASIAYTVTATDLASVVFRKIAASADGLDSQLERLSKRVADPEVDLEDAKFTAGIIAAAKRIDRLSAMMAKPGANLEDGKFQAEIFKINAQLDRLDKRHVTATVEVKTDRSGLLGRFDAGKGGRSGIGGWAGGIGALLGLGGSAAGAAGSGGGGGGGGGQAALYGAGGLAAALLGPAAIGTGIGGITGLGLIGGGLFGAAQGKTVLAADLKVISQTTTALKGAIGQQKQQLSQALQQANAQYKKDAAFYAPFTALQGAFKGLLQTILVPLRSLMVPLSGIIKDFGKGLTALGPQMTTMFRASLPFIRQFAQVMLQAGKILMPAFTQAMNQMVKSGALKLMTQGLVILIQGLARFIVALGPGMRASAQIFVFTTKVIALALQGIGKLMAWLANKIVQRVEDWRRTFDDFRHRTAVIFDGVRHDIAHVWDMVWQNTIGRMIKGQQDVFKLGDQLRHGIANTFDTIRHNIASAWDAIWNNTVGRVQRGVGDVERWFRNLAAGIWNVMRHLPGQLWNLAKDAIENIIKGATSVVPKITSFFTGFAHGIVGIFKKIWGWFSPSAVMFQGGKSLMEGLAQGIKAHEHKAVAAASAAAHRVANVGAGVQRWAGLVRRALSMEGLSQSLTGNVLYQMQTESGGNPNAINLTDSNAAAGDPSRGLMQVIGSTFGHYHWPGTSMNIYDPLANIAAALNYARHVYGPTLMSGGMGIGSGHGYDTGGWLPTGLSLAWNNTGQPERVLGPGQGGNTYNITVNVPPMANAAEAGRHFVAAILEFEKRSGAGWRR